MSTLLSQSGNAIANKYYYWFLGLLAWMPLPLASKRIWASMLLCVWVYVLSAFVIRFYIAHALQVPKPLRVAWPAFLLLGLSFSWQLYLSMQANVDAFSAYLSSMLALAYILIFLLCFLLINSTERIKACAWVLVFSALFQALYGSFMNLSGIEYLFFVPKDTYFGVNTGTFVNRNSQAGYLVMCCSIGIGLMISTLASTPAKNIREHSRRWMQAILSRKIILRLSLVMIVAGLVMTHSRMGNTSFFASLMIISPLALILGRFNKRVKNKGSWKGLFVLLASLVIIDIAVVGTFFGVDKVAQRLEATASEKETRDDVVKSSAPLLDKVYVTGLGGGSFYTAFPEYRTYETGRSFYNLAHNDYLQFILEFGLIGFLPLLLLCMIVFYLGLAVQMRRGDRLLRGMGFGVSMAVLSMGIHATVDFNLQMPANAGTFMVVLALGLIVYYFPTQGKRKRRGLS
ncbi:MAG: O-antigen ligase family protein [Cellvibrionaceae bacterium]|nr:O-antigen ligase family protein [Cellvibrionaceae bacterium]